MNAPGNWPKGSEAVIDRKVKEKILSYLSSYKTTPYPAHLCKAIAQRQKERGTQSLVFDARRRCCEKYWRGFY
jgi:hypothetical protein